MMTNLTLGLNPQAWAVLHGVVYNGEEYPDVDAYAWYNGRERGIVLVATTGPSERFYVACAEARSSDSIVVYHWDGKSSVNPPTVNDVHRKHGKMVNTSPSCGSIKSSSTSSGS